MVGLRLPKAGKTIALNIAEALKALGVVDTPNEESRHDLDERGYTVLPGIIDSEWLDALRARFE